MITGTLLSSLESANSFGLLLAQSNGDAAGAVFGLICMVVVFVGVLAFSVALGAFQIWMLIDCIIYESKMPQHDNQFVMWLLLIIFLGIIGSTVYYFARRPSNRHGAMMK